VISLQSKLRGDREGAEGRAALRCLRAIRARDLSALETAESETELVLASTRMACLGRPELLPPLLAEVRSLYSRLELEEAVVHKLEEGMEKHDAELLAAALAEAATLQLQLPVLGRAQRTLSVLRESADVLKALQAAMRMPKGSDTRVAALISALATADLRGLDGSAEEALPEVTEAKEMLSMARLEATILRRRETEPLGSLGARTKTPLDEGEVPVRSERRRGSVDATAAGRQHRQRGSFEAPAVKTELAGRSAAADRAGAGWASISPALRDLGAGLDRAAMRAAYVQASAAPRAPAGSDIYDLFRPGKKSQQYRRLRDYPRLRSRFSSLNAPAVPPQKSLLVLPVDSLDEATALRLAATFPAMLSPVASDDEILKLTTQLLGEGYSAPDGELRDELLLQLSVRSNHAMGSESSSAIGCSPLWLARWLCIMEGCCRLWRPSPALQPYLLDFVRHHPQLGTAEQRAMLLSAMDGAATPLDGAARDDVASIASWVVSQSGKTAQEKMVVPVLVQNVAHVFPAGTRAERVVSQLAQELKLDAASNYAVYADSLALGKAPLALSDSCSLIDGLRRSSSASTAGRLVFRRRIMHTNAVQASKPVDIALLYELVAAQLAEGGLRLPELGDVVTMLALRYRVECRPTVDPAAETVTRGQLAAWLAPSEAARTLWDPAVWIAEVNAVSASIVANKWSTLTCQRHFVRMAEAATEFGLALFSVCITAVAPDGAVAVNDAVVRLGVGRGGITLLPFAAAGSTSAGSAQWAAARELLGGKTHREFSFDAIAEWCVSEPPHSALVVTFEDWVGEGRRGALAALTVRGRSSSERAPATAGAAAGDAPGAEELHEIVELLTTYRSKFRKKRRKRKARAGAAAAVGASASGV